MISSSSCNRRKWDVLTRCLNGLIFCLERARSYCSHFETKFMRKSGVEVDQINFCGETVSWVVLLSGHFLFSFRLSAPIIIQIFFFCRHLFFPNYNSVIQQRDHFIEQWWRPHFNKIYSPETLFFLPSTFCFTNWVTIFSGYSSTNSKDFLLTCYKKNLTLKKYRFFVVFYSSVNFFI